MDRSQGPGMWDGCAKPVPRSSPRAPTPEAAAPLRSRAASAGSAETTGGQRAETRLLPGGRPAGRGGRRGRGPSRPRAPEPSSPPPRPARGVKRSGARGGRSFPRTGLPGKHWRSLFLERAAELSLQRVKHTGEKDTRCEVRVAQHESNLMNNYPTCIVLCVHQVL